MTMNCNIVWRVTAQEVGLLPLHECHVTVWQPAVTAQKPVRAESPEISRAGDDPFFDEVRNVIVRPGGRLLTLSRILKDFLDLPEREAGQIKLLESKVLLLGAGGLDISGAGAGPKITPRVRAADALALIA